MTTFTSAQSDTVFPRIGMYHSRHRTMAFRGPDTRRKPFMRIPPNNFPGSSINPPSYISKMPEPLDNTLDTNIFNLEWLACQIQNRALYQTGNQLKEQSFKFFGLRETRLPVGSVFVDRVSSVHENIRRLFPRQDLSGLEDFISRQKRTVLEREVPQLRVCRESLAFTSRRN